MSAESCKQKRDVQTKQRLTKIRERNDVHDAPDGICLIPLQWYIKLFSGPTFCAISANEVLCFDNLKSFTLRVLSIPSIAIACLPTSILSLMTKSYGDWVSIFFFDHRTIKLQSLGSRVPFYRELLAYQIQKTLFNCTLVDTNLRVSAEADFLAKDSLSSLYTPVAIRLLYHIRFNPSIKNTQNGLVTQIPISMS